MSLDVTNEDDFSLYDVLPAFSARTPVPSGAVQLQVETLFARLTPREQTILRLFEAAYARMEAQGLPITMLALAREAQVSTTTAYAYLCQRWGTVPQRLERAYAELVSTAAAITVERLAKAARLSERAANDFLHAQRGTTRQARPRQKPARQPA